MQCKDIPDTPVLEMLAKNPDTWHGWSDCHAFDLRKSMPEGISDRLFRAKMAKLIRKGFVDGCACGCRGDFTITQKGLDQVQP